MYLSKITYVSVFKQYGHYCLFHTSLPTSQSQLILQPIFEVSFLAQYCIECSEILYIALDIFFLGAPSSRTSNLIFWIFRFFTHNYIYPPESNASSMSSSYFYDPKKFRHIPQCLLQVHAHFWDNRSNGRMPACNYVEQKLIQKQ